MRGKSPFGFFFWEGMTMFENQNSSTVIQTSDLFLMKEGDAADKIGRHLLIVACYKNGAVIGSRFDKRQNEEQQWIKKLNSTSLVVGLGQYGCFRSFCDLADLLKLSITDNFLQERYVTLPVYDKYLTPIIRSAYESGKPLALDIMYVNLRSSKLKMARFNGDTATYVGFGVLGGYPYQDRPMHTLTGAETKGKTREQMSEMMKEMFESGVRNPVKDAVKAGLFECDPPSKKETFELTVFENGELKSVYLERPKSLIANIEAPS